MKKPGFLESQWADFAKDAFVGSNRNSQLIEKCESTFYFGVAMILQHISALAQSGGSEEEVLAHIQGLRDEIEAYRQRIYEQYMSQIKTVQQTMADEMAKRIEENPEWPNTKPLASC